MRTPRISVSVPCPELPTALDTVVLTSATAKNDSREIEEIFAHWPNWALEAVRDGLCSLLHMKVEHRARLADRYAQERRRRLPPLL